jgi:hypothetical protein
MIEENTALLPKCISIRWRVQEVHSKGDIWTISAVGTPGGAAVV